MQDRDKTEERARRLLETIPLGAAECDVEGRITFANLAYQKMLGYSESELAGKRVSDLLEPGPARDAFPAYLRQLALDQPPPSPYVCRDLTKDGRPIDVQVDWTYKRDPLGRVTGFVSILSDITKRKRAEQALQRANEELERKVSERTAELRKANETLSLFRLFAEAAGQGFGMADLDGVITYMNPALCRMAGVAEPGQALGRHLTTYYPEEYAIRRETEIIPALLRQGHWEGELAVVSGGKPMTVLQHSFLIRDEDGNPSRLASVITDITERKQAEEALRRSEERFRGYFVQGLIGMAVSTLQKRWLEVNDRLCEILGYSREELVEMKWTEATHPDDVEPSLLQFKQIAAGEIDSYTWEKRFVRKDGGVVYTNIFVRCFRRKDGTADHLLTLIEDITERKRAEEAVDRERQSLWQMLQAGDHERQTISYEIHDGLAQYLAAAAMQFQVHESLRANSPDEAARAYETAVELVRQAHFEARRLISEVRPPVIDEIGLETAISHLVHEQRRRGGPKIEFRSDVQFGRLPSILENSLYRIVQEALTNACKHSKSTNVTVTLAQEGQHVRLEVRDWGVGFDPKSVGTGHFGLEGIRQRVRLFGGRLAIDSRPDCGTLVQVVVPILERPSEA